MHGNGDGMDGFSIMGSCILHGTLYACQSTANGMI